MTVVLNTSTSSDHTVGLVAMSKHQGAWSHSPRQKLQEEPSAAFRRWLQANLGQGASRLQRKPLVEQMTGHTAVMSRVAGQVQFVRGFVPNVSGYVKAFFGKGGGGHWQNDLAMLADPTCICFAIPVTLKQAQNFQGWFNGASSAINVYSLRRGNASDTFNCVLGAVTVLTNYLVECGGHEPYVEQLLQVNSSAQGGLMQKISGGFQSA